MKKIGHLFLVCLLIVMLLGCKGEEEIQIANSDTDPSTIRVEDFWIDEQTFQVNDIRIVYPIIRTREANVFIDEINSEIKNFLFAGENEDFLTTYPGVIIVDNSYEVTYFDGEVLSICLYVDSIMGLGSGCVNRMGLTIDLSNTKKLRLSDFGFEHDYLCQKIHAGDYTLSNDFIAKPLAEEILVLLNSFDVHNTNNFYLSPKSIWLIVENQALSRVNVGVIEVDCGDSQWNVLNEDKGAVQSH